MCVVVMVYLCECVCVCACLTSVLVVGELPVGHSKPPLLKVLADAFPSLGPLLYLPEAK